jgi:hypothetical protein
MPLILSGFSEIPNPELAEKAPVAPPAFWFRRRRMDDRFRKSAAQWS